MNIIQIDNFAYFQISTCWKCESKKTRVHSWKELQEAWLCLKCWEEILTGFLADDDIKIDKNGNKYIVIELEEEGETIKTINMAIANIERKLQQVNSFRGNDVYRM